MGNCFYSLEMISFLRENIKNYCFKDLTKAFNSKFKTNKTDILIQDVCKRYKIYRIRFIYTSDMIQFLRDNAGGICFNDLADKFNDHFKLNKTRLQISTICSKYRVKTQYTARCGPRSPIGSERTCRGETFIKVGQPNMWVLKNRHIWELKNGKLPSGYCIIFADGNKNNFCESNLVKVSRSEVMIMNHLNLIFNDSELTKSGVAVARIHAKISEVTSNKKKEKIDE